MRDKRWALAGGRWHFNGPGGAAAFAIRGFNRIRKPLTLRVVVAARQLHAIDDHAQQRPRHGRHIDVVEAHGRAVITDEETSEAFAAKTLDGRGDGGRVRAGRCGHLRDFGVFFYGLD